jgi:hypothetical protein
MNGLIISKSRTTCAALALLAGSASTASAVDKHWLVNGTANWSTAANWSPAGQPGPFDDVNIGNVAGVHNSTVRLDLNEGIETLDISDGMTLDTSGFSMTASLSIDVQGRNVVGNSVFPSRLVVDHMGNGYEVLTQALTIHNYGEVHLNGGGISLDAILDIHANSVLRGTGTVLVGNGMFVNLTNDGTIAAGPGAMSITGNGGSLLDLDGTTGSGDLDLTTASNSSLTFNAAGIYEAFGGSLNMIRGTILHMNLGEHWTVENTGQFNIYGSGTGGAARITGSPLNFSGTINLYGGSDFRLESDVTFGVNSELVTGLNATADVTDDAVINGGLFTINNGSNLDFDGATTVHGGSFITHSDESTTGSVDFNGPTEWDGNISVTGFARQNGPAHVTGPTIITGDTFDMDGSDFANWDIDANLTMNVDRIDFAGNTFNTTMDIGAGRLIVNLSNPVDSWTMAGTLNLSGNNLLFSTKIDGASSFYLTGTINTLGKNDIFTNASIAGSSTINTASPTSALRFMANALIGTATTFTGAGTIQNGTNSVLTFNPGVNTNGVGLNIAGELRIGSGPGIMSVDRFTTTGTWNVDIRGHNAGTEHDRLVSNGSATLGGTLEVDLISGFVPAVGDEFTILNAVGGISGSFTPDVKTIVGATTYHWDVIIGAADVTLRLASIDEPCPADLDDGSFTGTPDDAVDINDLLYFISQFADGTAEADLDDGTFTGTPDAGVTIEDLLYFLRHFEGGC